MADKALPGFLVALKAEREMLQAIVNAMEARQLVIGTGSPPTSASALSHDIEDRKRTIGQLDALIEDYERPRGQT